jgi:hypothetical protein
VDESENRATVVYADVDGAQGELATTFQDL